MSKKKNKKTSKKNTNRIAQEELRTILEPVFRDDEQYKYVVFRGTQICFCDGLPLHSVVLPPLLEFGREFEQDVYGAATDRTDYQRMALGLGAAYALQGDGEYEGFEIVNISEENLEGVISYFESYSRRTNEHRYLVLYRLPSSILASAA